MWTKWTSELIRSMIKNISEHNDRSLGKYTYPFVPYLGERWSYSNPRILFVGKVHWIWPPPFIGYSGYNLNTFLEYYSGERGFFTDLKDMTNRFIKEAVIPFYGGKSRKGLLEEYCVRWSGSPFWNRIFRLTRALLSYKNGLRYTRTELVNGESERVFSSIAWTNFFKIGINKKGTDKYIRQLKGVSRNALIEEIKTLKPEPDVVVFSTGANGEYDEYLTENRGFELKDEIPGAGNSRELSHSEINDSVILIRTPHFQRFSNEHLCGLYEFIKGN
jgi:hypothetical protein